MTPGTARRGRKLSEPGNHTRCHDDRPKRKTIHRIRNGQTPQRGSSLVSRAVITALLTPFLLSGCMDSQDDLQGSRTIPAGSFFEINLVMTSGDHLEWTWNATGTLQSDVHTHFDAKVQTLHEETGTSGSGAFAAEHKGGHSLLWRNAGTVPVELEYALNGSFRLDSYYPAA